MELLTPEIRARLIANGEIRRGFDETKIRLDFLPVERDIHFYAKQPLSSYAADAREVGFITA